MEKVIVLDPGHGGRDPGAIGVGGVCEKNVVFGIRNVGGLLVADGMANRIAWALRNRGVTVVLTRESDVQATRPTRWRRAIAAKGSLYLSLHMNAADTPTARGLEIYYMNRGPCADQSEAYAYLLEEVVRQASGIPSRGVKPAWPYGRVKNVLKGVMDAMPAVLIEFAFITNKDDMAVYMDPQCRQRVADAIATSLAI